MQASPLCRSIPVTFDTSYFFFITSPGRFLTQKRRPQSVSRSLHLTLIPSSSRNGMLMEIFLPSPPISKLLAWRRRRFKYVNAYGFVIMINYYFHYNQAPEAGLGRSRETDTQLLFIIFSCSGAYLALLTGPRGTPPVQSSLLAPRERV